MIRLDVTTKILQLIATATANVTVSGLNVTTSAAPGFSEETAATASTQTISAAPAASTVKQIDHISIKNTGGGANTLTVQMLNSSGSVTTQVMYAVIAANETLEYTHAGGWQTLDATGSKKVGTAGWVIAAGKIGTLSNSLTFTGTDGSTLAVGTGGTLGTAAYTASTAYEASGGIATHAALTATHGVSGAIVGTTDSQALTNKTYNGHTFTAGSSTFTGTAAQTYTFPAASGTVATLALQGAISNPSNYAANFGSGTVTGGAITTTGAASGYTINRRDTNAYAYQWYSAAGHVTLDFASSGTLLDLTATALTLGSGITAISGGTNPSLNIGTGPLTAGAGTFSGALSATGDLTAGKVAYYADGNIFESATNAAAGISFNYVGYGAGTTQFRSVSIFDGKTNRIALFDGTANTVTFASLAGTGSRAVLADTNGLLSAPVSDERLKENFRPLGYGMPEIMQMADIFKEAGRFNFIDKKRFGIQDYLGASAQRVAKILPEVAGQMADGTWYLTEEKYGPLLFVGIADHEARIKALESLIQ